MAKPKALKVFRTAAGFHDAYVATPTKKAALEAWGSTRNLFAIGEAEQITDPILCQAPLARPGKVIKISRGTTAQQLAALPVEDLDAPKPAKASKPPTDKRKHRPAPRPSRAALDAAEQSLELARRQYEESRVSLDAEIEALRTKASAAKATWAKSAAVLESAIDQHGQAYDDAMARWRAND